MRLKDKVAVITGAGSGLGRAIAQRFVEEGATVLIADINEEAVNETVDEIRSSGGQASGLRVDVSRREDTQEMARVAAERHGRIDILVNNAGISRYRPFSTMTGDDWDAVLNVDLKGVFFCSQSTAPYMVQQKYGRVVNISSASGTGAAPHATGGSPGGIAAYASAKAGVNQLTKTLARELGPHGVTVNAIAPGTFLSPFNYTSRTAQEVEEHLEYRKKTVVLGKIGTLLEIANPVLFLASDESSYITGQTINVDGGRSDRI
ncbi:MULTISPECIES: SDR family NAD(P)-dependent oxidoreductase [unclassified Mesorhizobium]|uniref:SDR family NAD(P)-dependent oxidoreductase n=1 Tax=unclassified Mesorhizobium TaxID=325217 RepID=UPI000FD8A7EC|nr:MULTISPECIES: SDR family NAD(P)-dependent oxidoreductase [unclassified Mesorhizobium]TGR17942.1 SDR family oxidoreductase [Mesorhizobium sp. M8A.F.Ca.ET.197.01.1.1]TGR36586.1 SDR family oxidoreductase [bacterium M00.F.Ca.ET.199.01.1.1]TGR40133.1 SDR family oxidoreductase [Mesorhizobium sp. M8A.F.Ca.ET.198.01.1.1]TGV81628.1 SDR family oxidoreductase [Mesorhizobium sp. M00.F.Ca.ET.149.01.1.1]